VVRELGSHNFPSQDSCFVEADALLGLFGEAACIVWINPVAIRFKQRMSFSFVWSGGQANKMLTNLRIRSLRLFLLISPGPSGLENREYGRKDPSRLPRGTLYLQRLALTSPTSGDLSVDIVHSRTQATEFSFS
jgi:hypothetical protein